jgi:hypothetical protein
MRQALVDAGLAPKDSTSHDFQRYFKPRRKPDACNLLGEAEDILLPQV